MKKKVFVCYRQATSKDFVEHLVDRLREMFVVHYDGDHVGAGSVLEMIEKDIDDCTHFILVVDEETFKFKENKEDDYVLNEIECILKKKQYNKKIKIVPILKSGGETPSKEKLKDYKIEKLDFENRESYREGETFDDFFSRFLSDKMECDISIEKRKRRFMWCILAIVLTAIGMWVGTYLQQYISSKTPKLVFAGGGSVANMIKDITNDAIDIKNYSNSIYLDLPSKNAWSLLAEEVMINHTSDSVTNKFYPVCLSALEAEDSAFHKIVIPEKFKEKGTVISYYLGEDTLVVYTNDDSMGENGQILIGELSKKVKEGCTGTSVNVYITQEGSGTYLTYQELLKDTINIDNCKGILKWYDAKLLYKNLNAEEDKFIVLTSKHYTPEDIIGKCKRKVVMNERGDTTLTKAMYLYFAGYTNPEQPYVSIPEEMVEFLKKIKNDTTNVIKPRMHQDSTWIITPLETLMRWEQDGQKSKRD